MLKRQPGYIYLALIVSMAIALGFTIFAIYSYQRHLESQESIFQLKRQVREKLVIDSVLSVYEAKHRQRLDSIQEVYIKKLDSLKIMIGQLNEASNVIQNKLIATDSVLPEL